MDAVFSYSVLFACYNSGTLLPQIDSHLISAEDALARQLEDIHELKDLISSEGRASSYLRESLERQQREAAEKERQHRVSVTELEDKMTSMKEELSSYITQYQRAAEISEKLQEELDASRSMLTEQKREHEDDVARLKLQLQEVKQQHSAKEKELNKSIVRLGKELQSSQLALEQYKHDAQSLEDQLQKSKQAVKAKEKELHLLHGQIAQHKTISQPLDDEELMMLQKANDQLKIDIEGRVEEVRRAEEEAQKLRLQLASANKEISMLSSKHSSQLEEMRRELQTEMSRAKVEGDSQVAAVRAALERELRMSKERYDIQFEQIHQELKGSQLNYTQLQGKLESAEQQCESLLLQVSQNKETEAGLMRQVKEFQAIQTQYKEEVAHYKKSMEEKELKLTQMAEVERQLKSHIGSLQEQLRQSQRRQAALVDDMAMEETEFGLEALPVTSPMSPSRHSYQSDRSFHEEVVTQMKSQLEELQMCLLQQGSPVKSNELSLVQELISNNTVLKEELEKVQADREAEVELMAIKDLELLALKTKLQQHDTVLKKLKDEVAEKVDLALKSLRKRSDSSIEDSLSKLEAASQTMSLLSQTVQEMEECHTNALETLYSELSQSKSVQESYQQEMDQLQTSLDQSLEEFHHSEQELKQQLQAKEMEVTTLREKLSKIQTNYQFLQAKITELESEPLAPTISPAASASAEAQTSATALQWGEEGEDTHLELLQQKTEEMEVLREEARRAQQLRGEMQTMTEEIQQELRQKGEQMQQMEEQIWLKEQEIRELQHKLETVVNEPVEAVVQYIESAPLESVNDAMFASMQQEVQSEKEHFIQQQMQHKDEIEKVNHSDRARVCLCVRWGKTHKAYIISNRESRRNCLRFPMFTLYIHR